MYLVRIVEVSPWAFHLLLAAVMQQNQNKDTKWNTPNIQAAWNMYLESLKFKKGVLPKYYSTHEYCNLTMFG